MDSLKLKFDSTAQLQSITWFVESVFNMYNGTSLNVIKSLNDKLESMDHETTLSVDLSNDEVDCLGNICDILSCVSTDDVITGYNVLSKIARLISIKSDVPRFLAMLKENHIPAEHCVDLFGDWCSGVDLSVLAEHCMNIQYKYNVNMIAVWKWMYANSPNTDWRENVARFKEAVARFKEAVNGKTN